MILQKSFEYVDLVLKKHVFIINIKKLSCFVKNVTFSGLVDN